jgi:hypothetical protein
LGSIGRFISSRISHTAAGRANQLGWLITSFVYVIFPAEQAAPNKTFFEMLLIMRGVHLAVLTGSFAYFIGHSLLLN